MSLSLKSGRPAVILPLTTRSVPFWPGQTLTLELWGPWRE